MIAVDLRGMSAVITGGTRGIGHAIALELSRAGAHCYVTHRWSSVDDDTLAATYEAEPHLPPIRDRPNLRT